MKQLIFERAKTIGIGIAVALSIALLNSSCATVNRDCHGVKLSRPKKS